MPTSISELQVESRRYFFVVNVGVHYLSGTFYPIQFHIMVIWRLLTTCRGRLVGVGDVIQRRMDESQSQYAIRDDGQ